MCNLNHQKRILGIKLGCLIIALCASTACWSVEILEWELVNTLPHDQTTWTQGLFYAEDGDMIESSGLYEKSYVRELNPDTQKPKRTKYLPANLFAEGITVHQDELFVLTWKENVALVLDPTTFKDIRSIPVTGEGWGITSTGEQLWMSNGSDRLINIDPQTGTPLGSVSVTHQGQPLNYLNELEWIEGYIYANRWFDHSVYVIDPESGAVVALINLNALAEPQTEINSNHVLNGIAWNADHGLLSITGKYWPVLHQLKISPYKTLSTN